MSNALTLLPPSVVVTGADQPIAAAANNEAAIFNERHAPNDRD